jgi:SIR2-like protein
MAQIFALDTQAEVVTNDLTRALQSAHINVLLGAGASQPAIPLTGNIEREIETLLAAGDDDAATRRMYDLLSAIQVPTNRIITRAHDASCTATLDRYTQLLRTVETIITERRTTILPKQATIFTTNYDLFIDAAAKACEAAALANGFDRGASADDAVEYSTRRFSLTTYDTGNLYEYRVELPALNLVKLHGCLSWQKDGERIILRTAQCDLLATGADAAAVKTFIARYAVVLPQAAKFNRTVLDRTYYELLRLFANALDMENVLLITFGFSFRDEHILHITRRALKNPTLRLVIFAYDEGSRDEYGVMFGGQSNVIVVSPPTGEVIDFDRFNGVLADAAPKPGAR